MRYKTVLTEECKGQKVKARNAFPFSYMGKDMREVCNPVQPYQLRLDIIPDITDRESNAGAFLTL